MDRDQLLHQLRTAIWQLSDAVADMPPTAAALRRLADRLPAEAGDLAPPATPPASSLSLLLYDALVDGVLDARRFDHAMLLRARAEHRLAARIKRAA